MRYHDPRRRLTSGGIGVLLVLLGLVLLVATQTGFGGILVPGAVGLCLLAAYAYRQRHGLLVAGSVLTGLGAGLVLEDRFGGGGAAVLAGLGAGFVSFFAIDCLHGLHRAHWWPLLPGAVLLLAAADVATGSLVTLGWLAGWWPVALVALGVLILVGGAGRSRPEA
jgi:hypothetical protein